jgi:hypothetical protein
VDFFVQTILCRDCRQLYDAVTRIRWPQNTFRGKLLERWRLLTQTRNGPAGPPTFDSALNRLRLGAAAKRHWVHFPAQCPVSPTHRFDPWNHPDKCPRCSLFLEKNVLPYRIWE